MLNGARRAFFKKSVAVPDGQFWPMKLGHLLASRRTEGREGRILHSVRVYTGRPDPALQSTSAAANVRQCQAWERTGAYVFHRPLRYPYGWPNNRDGGGPQEKGIDVAIAVDLVDMAHRREYDVAIVCSADSDLSPAIEKVRATTGVEAEVASWRQGSYGHRIFSRDQPDLFCHWLYQDNFEAVQDETDYTKPPD